MLFFEVRNLSAEHRLAGVQFIRGPREVQFLGQDDDGMQLNFLCARPCRYT